MPKTFLNYKGTPLATVYKTDEIVANPTLEGTEGNLTGLQVGDTKYKIPSNGQKFLHRVCINYEEDEGSDGFTCYIEIRNESSEKITTMEQVNTWAKDLGTQFPAFIVDPDEGSWPYYTYAYYHTEEIDGISNAILVQDVGGGTEQLVNVEGYCSVSIYDDYVSSY